MNGTILAIDIGSTKISAVVAQANHGQAKILGQGVSKSQGIKKGIISNIDLASKSIRNAVSDAKKISGTNVSSAIVTISNAYAKSINSNGIVNITNNEITLKEINRAMQTALYNAKIPDEYEIIHVLPYNFTVDEQEFIEDPFGMNASRLEVNVNIIMTQKSNLFNLKKAINSVGIEIESIVLSGYASALAVISDEERAQGVGVIDIGGQTSDLIIHTGNAIRYTDFLGVGSNHISNDLSMALHTPVPVAENIKLNYIDFTNISNEDIEIPIIGDESNTKSVSLDMVYNVVFARVEETLMLLADSIENSSLANQMNGGIVITGGMSKLKGIKELAQSIFTGLSVRIGQPKELDNLFDELKDPTYAATVGLILYKLGYHTPYEINFKQQMLHTKDDYKDNLSDIKLSSDEEIQIANTNNIELAQDNTNQNNDIRFDELPDLESDNTNVFKKISSWAKGLF